MKFLIDQSQSDIKSAIDFLSILIIQNLSEQQSLFLTHPEMNLPEFKLVDKNCRYICFSF